MPWTLPPPPPPTLSIGEAGGVTVARAALTIRGRHATLTLVLTTTTRTRHEIALPLAIPHAAAVTGMTVVEGDHRTVAIAQTPMRASDRYEETVQQVVDPVLLEHAPAGDTREQDQLRLRVFPLAKAEPVTVEIALELPDGPELVLEPGAHGLARVEIDTGGAPIVLRRLRDPHAIELPDGEAAPELSLVGTHSSLLAEPQLELAAAAAALPGGPPGLRTATEIRDGIRRNLATLVHCAEVDPTPRALGFVIAADGTVSDIAGADACTADEIRRWRFAPAREATHIVYPLSWDVVAP